MAKVTRMHSLSERSVSSNLETTEDAELLRSLRRIRKSIEDVKGGRVRPMKEFLKSLAAKHGISLDE
jgi:hypothetical protein